MESTCARCGAAMSDAAALCHPCTDHLAGRLRDIPVLLAELDVQFSRQSRASNTAKIPTGVPGSVHPDMSVADAAGLLRSACAGWAHTYDGYTGRAPWHYLWENLDAIRLHNWSVMLDADIARRASAAWRKIDRPESRWYAGVCGATLPDPEHASEQAECGRVLWAAIDDSEITCPACHTRWSVSERRDYLIRSAEDFELPPRAAATIVSYVLASRVSENTVKSWLARGHLIPRQRGPQRVRVGDVITEVLRRQPGVETVTA